MLKGKLPDLNRDSMPDQIAYSCGALSGRNLSSETPVAYNVTDCGVKAKQKVT